MTQPLSGIKVLDFSTLLPGPMASLFLAEAGAEVIKVERPGTGEDMRGYTPSWGAGSVNFALLNRGKVSVTLDLKTEDGKAAALDLARSADIVLEQFRPGVMDRLGLGYEAMRGVNPKVIYCAITGYGQTGPKAQRAGHDLNYIGDAGLLAVSAGQRGARVVPPALIADIAGGSMPAVINILLALRQRDLTGSGSFLDISMTESLFPFLYWAIGGGLSAGEWPGSGDAMVTGGSPRYRLYDTADGRIAAVAALEPKFWAAFTEAIGLDPALRDDRKDPAATIRAVEAIIADNPADYWGPVFLKADCCCTIVQDIRSALDDPHFQARGLFDRRLTNETGDSIPALPVPIMPQFRAPSRDAAAPPLGGGNDRLTNRKGDQP
jgi:crotonobetainyl-CoA:carnitine CoA-transferase CaiB-like acyl-CoA transferase